MKRRRLQATGLLLFGLGLAGAGLGSGCTATVQASGGITAPANCQQDSTVDCSGGGDGFACDSGVNPEDEDPTLSCSTPQSSAGEDDYCCFTAPSGFTTTTCEQDDNLTTACPDPDSYGYQCATGDDPAAYDPTLNCGPSTSDADGVHADFCCEYGSATSSSGGGDGGVPPNCTEDDSLVCVGGATGYSCDPGDNPELEDTSLSCSTPAMDENGNDDYCCYTGGSWSDTTCEPDDDLSSLCPDPTSYGYQCDIGDDPTSYDPTLTCSTNAPDGDGVHDDFCCAY